MIALCFYDELTLQNNLKIYIIWFEIKKNQNNFSSSDIFLFFRVRPGWFWKNRKHLPYWRNPVITFFEKNPRPFFYPELSWKIFADFFAIPEKTIFRVQTIFVFSEFKSNPFDKQLFWGKLFLENNFQSSHPFRLKKIVLVFWGSKQFTPTKK